MLGKHVWDISMCPQKCPYFRSILFTVHSPLAAAKCAGVAPSLSLSMADTPACSI